MLLPLLVSLLLAATAGAARSENGVGAACPSGYAIRGTCVPVGVSPLDFYVNSVKDEGLPVRRERQQPQSIFSFDTTHLSPMRAGAFRDSAVPRLGM